MIDTTFSTIEGRFNYRCGGILFHNNKLLVMKDHEDERYYLPGGRAHVNEDSVETIKREFREELKIEINVNRLVFVHENFFTLTSTQEKYHEIGLYYLVEEKDCLLDFDEFETIDEVGNQLECRFVTIEELKVLPFLHKGLIPYLECIPNYCIHIIEK